MKHSMRRIGTADAQVPIRTSAYIPYELVESTVHSPVVGVRTYDLLDYMTSGVRLHALDLSQSGTSPGRRCGV